MFSKSTMNNLSAPAFFLLLSTFLVGVPESGARGGKGAKGAGGVTGYGHRGVYNSAAYEMTWEDIVLAMQLSAMCFGALLALCIVACCAYKICGPAEDEDWSRRYRTTFKPVSRLTPEMLKEVYTLPTTVLASNGEQKNTTLPPIIPATMNTTLHKHTLSEGAILGTAVSVEIPHQQQQIQQQLLQQQFQQQHLQQQQQLQQFQQQQLRPLPPPPNLPNGRVIMEESARGGGGCLSFGGVLDHRPRVVTLSSLSTSRLMNEARRPGVAPRLAAHLNNSTLDLAHPQSVFMPIINASSRSLSEPQTAIV